MEIGLKRGVVALADHDPEWENLARETIGRLWRIFGAAADGGCAVDIQHIGITSIRSIKAKPIIDIAVAVNDLGAVERLTPALEAEGFRFRRWETDDRILYAVGDYANPDGLVTHFIHVSKADGDDWLNYIHFRDYLNANAQAAKAYEELKLRLAAENPLDKGREKYLAGKHDFVERTTRETHAWAALQENPQI